MPDQWDGSHWSSPAVDGATVTDGMFSGTFDAQAREPEHLERSTSNVSYSSGDVHPAVCEPAPGRQPATDGAPTSTTPTTTPTADPQSAR